MNMTLRRGLSAILPAACAAFMPALALDLREAQARLFRNNPDLAILKLEVERSQHQWQEAKAAWMPSVDAMGSYGYATETSRLQLDLPFPPPAGTQIDRTLGDHDRAELGVDAGYALFTGFARGRNQQAKKSGMLAMDAQWRGARNRMSLQLAAMFHAWQLAGAQAAYQEKAVRHARELSGQLRDFVRAGTAVRSRALAAEARAKAAEVDLLTAQNLRDSLSMEVLDFIGGDDGPETRLTPDTSEAPEPDWARQPAPGTMRPDAEALEHAAAQARFGEKALAGQRLPQVFGTAGLRYANPGLNLAGDEFMPWALVGLQLKWNLVDGGRNRSQRRQLEVQARALGERKRKLENEWSKSMRIARLQHSRWKAQYEAAKASRDAAREAAADLRRQFEAGLATEVDWLEARNNEARAEMMMDQASTMQRLTMLQWDYAAGKELEF
jgi:outer membrane protein TolC